MNNIHHTHQYTSCKCTEGKLKIGNIKQKPNRKFTAKGNCKQRIECVLRIPAKSQKNEVVFATWVTFMNYNIEVPSTFGFKLSVQFFPLFVRAQIRKVVKLFIRFISKVQQRFAWHV